MILERETNIYNDSALAHALQTQDTKISVMQGEINAIISETEMTELLNGGKTMYSAMNDISVDVSGVHGTLSSMQTTISGQGNQITSIFSNLTEISASIDGLSGRISSVSDDVSGVSSRVTDLSATVDGVSSSVTSLRTTLSDDYSTTAQMNSAISQSASNITQSVSETYATKAQLGDYSTTTQMNSAISQSASEILLDVSGTYATKQYVDDIEIGGRNLFLNTLAPGTGTSDRPRLIEQNGSNSVVNGTAVVAEHGIRSQRASSGYPYIRFGSNTVSASSMNGLKAGKKYTISADVAWKLLSNSSTSSAILRLRTMWVKQGTSYFTGEMLNISTEVVPGTEESARVEHTFEMPEDAIGFYMEFGCNIVTSSAYLSGDYIELANLKIEEGDHATAWTPAPEDLQKYTNAQIKIASDEINLEVDKKVGTDEIISKINLSTEGVVISGDKIDFTGVVTFNDLKTEGATVINGSNITTGSITANLIDTGTMLADRIYGGTLKLGGANGQNGILEVYNSSGTKTGSLTNGGLESFKTGTVGSTTYSYKSELNESELSFYIDNTKTIATEPVYGSETYYDQSGGRHTGSSGAMTALDVFKPFYIFVNRGTGYFVRMSPTASPFPTPLVVGQNTLFSYNLTVYGTKSRAAKTDMYGERLLYAYEMPAPMFGDIGQGRIDEHGECIVDIDDVFSETIEESIEYQVFLQKEGEGDLWVENKKGRYFTVKGTPGVAFSWEVKAKQRSFETERLESFDGLNMEETPETPESVYDEELENLINEQEEILYEAA